VNLRSRFTRIRCGNLIGNNIKIDPKSMDNYLAVGGYSALAKALFQETPERVVELVKNSNLRGSGGAGFPAGLKVGVCPQQC
jgi:NADP-reducing hydrogenase subunit HndC